MGTYNRRITLLVLDAYIRLEWGLIIGGLFANEICGLILGLIFDGGTFPYKMTASKERLQISSPISIPSPELHF